MYIVIMDSDDPGIYSTPQVSSPLSVEDSPY